MTSSSQFEPGKSDDADHGWSRHERLERDAASSITGLVRKRAHDVVDLGAGRGLVGGLDREADALADRHAADAVEPERRQRPLDRGALRVGDALLVIGPRRGPRSASWASRHRYPGGSRSPPAHIRRTAVEPVMRS